MATQSRQIAEFENGLCTAWIVYDDATLRISQVHVINNGAAALYVEVRRGDGLVYSNRFAPGDTFINVPTTGANRIQFTDLGRGHWQNVSWSTWYPYP